MKEFMTFGDFIGWKRREISITVRALADKIDVSPGYYNDIEKDRRNPPDRLILDKMIRAFHLDEDEQKLFFDLAGKARSEVSPDLPEYIMENEYVRVALRVAKKKASDEDWKQFISILECKEEPI